MISEQSANEGSMDPSTFVDPQLTIADRHVLDCLLSREQQQQGSRTEPSKEATPLRFRPDGQDSGYESQTSSSDSETPPNVPSKGGSRSSGDLREATVRHLQDMNDPAHQRFETNVFSSWDTCDLEARLPTWCQNMVLKPYIRWARTIVRHPSDVIMVTHLLIYSTTTIPSALLLFVRFRWWHGVIHLIMQLYFTGTYTLM